MYKKLSILTRCMAVVMLFKPDGPPAGGAATATIRAYGVVYEEFKAKQQQLKDIFDKYTVMDGSKAKLDDEGKQMYAIPSDKLPEINRRNHELGELGKELEAAKGLQNIVSSFQSTNTQLQVAPAGFGAPNTPTPQGGGFKTIGDKFLGSEEWKTALGSNGFKRFSIEIGETEEDFWAMKAILSGNHFVPGGGMKTTMTEAAGYAPFVPRGPLLFYTAMQLPTLADWIPTDPTQNIAVKYMEETTFTNNAAAVAEGAQKPESALAFTERTVPIAKIAHFVPATDEQLTDVPALRGIVDNRMTLMLRLAEETELLSGNGTPPHLQGFLTKSGTLTRAQAGGENNADTIFKAMQDVRFVGFAEPFGIVLSPDNWTPIRLMKTTTNEYIWGSPSEPGPDRLWGKPVRVTAAMTSGKALLGDFPMYSHISRKLGIRIDISDSHSDFFIKNLLAIRAEMRESLEIYRAAAFNVVTGLA